MVRILVLTFAVLLAGCSDSDESKREAKKAADQSALQGRFKPSAPLDYSKYAEPEKPASPAPRPAPHKQKLQRFKKSPTLNYLKYVQGGVP